MESSSPVISSPFNHRESDEKELQSVIEATEKLKKLDVQDAYSNIIYKWIINKMLSYTLRERVLTRIHKKY